MRKPLLAALVFLLASIAQSADRPYTRNVAIVVYEGAEPLDWAGPYEVYHNAAVFGRVGETPAFHVYIVSKTGKTVDSQGLNVAPQYSIANAPKPDIVVFPGGGTNNILGDPEFFAWGSRVATEAEIAQSVCTGAFVLAKAGLLDNQKVTTWYGAIEHLRAEYPKLTVENGRRYIDNGRTVTTAGISAGIDGSMHVVARLLGRRVADQVARYMEYHWTPEAYLSTQYTYLNPSTDERGRLYQSADLQREEKRYADAAGTYRQLLAQNEGDSAAWLGLGQVQYEQRQYAAAAGSWMRAAAEPKAAPRAFYRAACAYALASQREEAIASLQKAFGAGFRNRAAIDHDPDLASIRDDPRVKKIASTAP